MLSDLKFILKSTKKKASHTILLLANILKNVPYGSCYHL